MARQIRLAVFVDQDELDILRSVVPQDSSVGRTVRQFALDKANWLRQRGLKHRPKAPYERQPVEVPDGPTYDYSDRQDAPGF